MARDKKSMIGFDPLAWLDDGSSGKDATEKKSGDDGKKSDNAKKKSSGKSSMIDVLGHSIDETALSKGYSLAESVIDEVVEDFYRELFDQYPGVKPLFKNTDDKSQAGKLSAALSLLMNNLHDEDALRTTLEDMGRRHQKYGALPEHYPVVAELLIASFKKKIGRSWTKAISAAWLSLLGAAAETMYSVYVDKDDITEPDDEAEADNVIQLKSVQDISKSQTLKNDLIMLVNENDEIDIDGSLVERIDGSALQLICALFIYAKQNNLAIHWIDPSDALLNAAEVSGVSQILDLV